MTAPLVPDVPDPTPAELDRVAETLAARDDLWASLAARLGPDEGARVAGARGWEAWLRRGTDPDDPDDPDDSDDSDDVVRLEVRARFARPGGRTPRAVARWRRTEAGLSRLQDRRVS